MSEGVGMQVGEVSNIIVAGKGQGLLCQRAPATSAASFAPCSAAGRAPRAVQLAGRPVQCLTRQPPIHRPGLAAHPGARASRPQAAALHRPDDSCSARRVMHAFFQPKFRQA